MCQLPCFKDVKHKTVILEFVHQMEPFSLFVDLRKKKLLQESENWEPKNQILIS